MLIQSRTDLTYRLDLGPEPLSSGTGRTCPLDKLIGLEISRVRCIDESPGWQFTAHQEADVDDENAAPAGNRAGPGIRRQWEVKCGVTRE